jgi:hypothetical protein
MPLVYNVVSGQLDKVNPVPVSGTAEAPIKFANVATTAALASSTYDNGLGTLTKVGNGALPNQDGQAPFIGMTILVWKESNKITNGIYEVTDLGDGSNPWVLTRIDAYNETAEIYPSQVNVLSGNIYINKYFLQKTVDPVVGTNNIVFQTVSTPASVQQVLPVAFVDVHTESPLPNSPNYVNGITPGAPGAQAWYAGTTNGAFPTLQGVTPFQYMRVLVKDQADQTKNGDYLLMTVGSASNPWRLYRISYADPQFHPRLWEVYMGTSKGKFFQQETKGLLTANIGISGNVVFVDVSPALPTINYDNNYYVSPTGNDGTAVAGDFSKPYLTAEAAVAACPSGGAVVFLKGTHTVTTTATNGIAKDGIRIDAMYGAVVNKASSGDLFNLNGFSTGFNVYGYGEFNKTTTAGSILTTTGVSFDINFDFTKATSTQSGSMFKLNDYAGFFKSKFNNAVSTGGEVLGVRGISTNSRVYIDMVAMKSTASYVIGEVGFAIDSLNIEINGVELSSSANDGVRLIRNGCHVKLNVNRITGLTYGVSTDAASGQSYVNISTNYINGINTAASDNTEIVVEGRCYNLVNGGSNVLGGIYNKITSNNAKSNTIGDVYPQNENTLTVSDGYVEVNILRSPHSISFNNTGGYTVLKGDYKGTSNRGSRIINGASATVRLDMDYFYQGSVFNGSKEVFTLQDGFLDISNKRVHNGMTGDGRNTCVLQSGGKILSNGGRLTTAEATNSPIIASGASRVLNLGSLRTNIVDDGGTLSVKKQKHKLTVTSVASTSVTLNDNSGAEVFTESDTGTYSTTALLAQQMAVLINASGTLDITASQDTPGTDTYFYVEMDTGGIPMTVSALTNLTEVVVRGNSYGFTIEGGGTVTDDTNTL